MEEAVRAAVESLGIRSDWHMMNFHTGERQRKWYAVSFVVDKWVVQKLKLSKQPLALKTAGRVFSFPFSAGHLRAKADFPRYWKAFMRANHAPLSETFLAAVFARLQEWGPQTVLPEDGGNIDALRLVALDGMEHSFGALRKHLKSQHKCAHGKYGGWHKRGCKHHQYEKHRTEAMGDTGERSRSASRSHSRSRSPSGTRM
jgi:hypothetical protein